MFLKRLELHGFKSFAGATTLDFQRGISAVVGPNGSGKSNIADALRFVLGEQSMRLIRSKRGEDLIFSGSATKPRMNMASVTLTFDNADHAFPVEFDDVVLKRKIFRDGENQYSVNDAQVRLKDLAEYIAKAHLGLKGYTVINQGMGDAILNASPRERREIVFEALGLKEYQMKRADAISKLAHTQVNLEKAQGVIAEIEPHLRFLKKQADKLDERQSLEVKLRELEFRYFKTRMMRAEHALTEKRHMMTEIGIRIERNVRDIATAQTAADALAKEIAGAVEEAARSEHELARCEQERGALEREIGKIEGMLAALEHTPEATVSGRVAVDIGHVAKQLAELSRVLDEVLREPSLESMRIRVSECARRLSALREELTTGAVHTAHRGMPVTVVQTDTASLASKKDALVETLRTIETQCKSIRTAINENNRTHHAQKETIFELRNTQREKEDDLARARQDQVRIDEELKILHTEIEALNAEKRSLVDAGNSSLFDDASAEPVGDEEVRRSIERLKFKLESIDLIDESVRKEFEDTQKRYQFLTGESQDLENAIGGLERVITELDAIIETRFVDAFRSINGKFNDYFQLLFEGGSARLELVDNEDERPEEESARERQQSVGIDILVALPRKKAIGLSVLSGGERTLTSLALLFALVSVSPPPFLVLDEIDAPLDEANSVRFARILNELKSHTQFIVITHNRETMRQSDILYGITMEEDGISKILSLKFDEAARG